MKRSIAAMTAAVGLAVASSTTAFAASGNSQTEKVKLDELPPAVQNTINQHAEGGKIKRVERTTENGQTFYQVSLKANGQKQEFKVSSDGQFLGPQSEKQSIQNSPSQTTPMGNTRGQQPPEPQR